MSGVGTVSTAPGNRIVRLANGAFYGFIWDELFRRGRARGPFSVTVGECSREYLIFPASNPGPLRARIDCFSGSGPPGSDSFAKKHDSYFTICPYRAPFGWNRHVSGSKKRVFRHTFFGRSQKKQAAGCPIGKNPCFFDRAHVGEGWMLQAYPNWHICYKNFFAK